MERDQTSTGEWATVFQRYMDAVDEHGIDSPEACLVAANHSRFRPMLETVSAKAREVHGNNYGHAERESEEAEEQNPPVADMNERSRKRSEMRAATRELYRETLANHYGIRANAARELGCTVDRLSRVLKLSPPKYIYSNEQIIEALAVAGSANEAARILDYRPCAFRRRINGILAKQSA